MPQEKNHKGQKMILADYRCGCTWVGQSSEKLEYCAKHGEDYRRSYPIGRATTIEKGWCWQLPDNLQNINPDPVLLKKQ